jgi:hypothetical protein
VRDRVILLGGIRKDKDRLQMTMMMMMVRIIQREVEEKDTEELPDFETSILFDDELRL